MTLDEMLAWKINSWAGYVPMMLRSEHASVRAAGERLAGDLAMLRQVSARRHAPHTLTPEMAAWWRWIQAIAPTYANHPRECEAQNTEVRKAALETRDRELSLMKGKAA